MYQVIRGTQKRTHSRVLVGAQLHLGQSKALNAQEPAASSLWVGLAPLMQGFPRPWLTPFLGGHDGSGMLVNLPKTASGRREFAALLRPLPCLSCARQALLAVWTPPHPQAAWTFPPMVASCHRGQHPSISPSSAGYLQGAHLILSLIALSLPVSLGAWPDRSACLSRMGTKF